MTRKRLGDRPLTFDDLVPPVTDLREDFSTAMSSWRWLVPSSAEPLLLTALGDLFVFLDTSISFLDTERGTLGRVASDQGEWKQQMQDPARLAEWFRPAFIASLRRAGLSLAPGEVFSPLIPVVVGGRRTPDNYTTSQWRSHLHLLGQIHDQVRLLPPGTTIERLVIEPPRR